MEYTCLSKRKLQWFVDSKRVEGWNDPRFPTVRGVIRKGIRVETLTEFMLEQGPSKRSNLMEWEKLWAINKRIIDPICPRYSAVKKEKACRLLVSNVSAEPEAVTVPMSKLNLQLGERPLWKTNNILLDFADVDTLIKEGDKVTLMNWGNFMIQSKEQQDDGSYLLKGEFLPEDTDFKKTVKVTWLADCTDLLVADFTEYDHLIKEKKVEENVDFETIVNVNSKFSAEYYVDSNIRTLNAGQFLQFERKGYYKIDKVENVGDDLKYTFIYTPDGKKVGLASTGTMITAQSDVKKETLDEKKKNKNEKKEKKDKKEKKEENPAKEDGEKKVEETKVDEKNAQ